MYAGARHCSVAESGREVSLATIRARPLFRTKTCTNGALSQNDTIARDVPEKPRSRHQAAPLRGRKSGHRRVLTPVAAGSPPTVDGFGQRHPCEGRHDRRPLPDIVGRRENCCLTARPCRKSSL
jgi:hypothetical protein